MASKVFSRWIGPGLVIHVQSPNSYVAEFDDGLSRTIHVNYLRKFHSKAQKMLYDPVGLSREPDVNSCAIVSEQDQKFGDLHAFDYDCAVIGIDSKVDSQLPSQLIDRSTFCHLSARQQSELLQVLDKYADCFSVRPGLTTRVEHSIEITPGFKPKHMRKYKVPDA